jgi:hypothetical protein
MTYFETTELFEEIFDEVMNDLHIGAWWELFDDPRFTEVEKRVAEKFGVNDAYELDYFPCWVREMAADL